MHQLCKLGNIILVLSIKKICLSCFNCGFVYTNMHDLLQKWRFKKDEEFSPERRRILIQATKHFSEAHFHTVWR